MKSIKLAAILFFLVAFILSGCAEDNDPVMENASYLGSTACRVCHGDIYATFIETGHNFILNKVSGAAPAYPSFAPGVPNPPNGYIWDDITYVIGGFGWKANFIGTDGYIIIGTNVQYNIEDSSWSAYRDGETVSYDCGSCHAAGWNPSGGNQDGLAGMSGMYGLAGVQCERCHGAGGAHVNTVNKQYITKNTDAAACGHCHYNTTDHRILASSGFIANHSQYDEFLASPHANSLTCVTCHDPHKTTKYDSQTAYEGILYVCQDCHTQVSYHKDPSVTCLDCHMPKLIKSAIETKAVTGNAPAVGDVRAHLIKIDSTPGLTQFYLDSSDGNTYSNGYITLEYVCLRCHTGQTASWAEGEATTIHTAP